MNVSEYFPVNFSKDVNLLKGWGISCLCGRVWDEIYSKAIDINLVDVNLFIICSFELNIIDQMLYSHAEYRQIHTFWKSDAADFISSRCTYMSSPIEMIKYAKSSSNKSGRPLQLRRIDLKEADAFFFTMLTENQQYKVNVDEFKTAIQSDPDYSEAKILQILDS